jgi:hypothetical protein
LASGIAKIIGMGRVNIFINSIHYRPESGISGEFLVVSELLLSENPVWMTNDEISLLSGFLSGWWQNT